MSQETGDLTTKQGGALATLDFVSDSGMGLENIDKSDLALPFLKLLQSGSDETKNHEIKRWFSNRSKRDLQRNDTSRQKRRRI